MTRGKRKTDEGNCGDGWSASIMNKGDGSGGSRGEEMRR